MSDNGHWRRSHVCPALPVGQSLRVLFGMLLIVLSCHGGSPLAVLAVPPSLTQWYRPSAWGMQPEEDCRLPVSRHATGKLLVSHYRPETVMDGPYPKISAPTGVGSCCLSELVSRR